MNNLITIAKTTHNLELLSETLATVDGHDFSTNYDDSLFKLASKALTILGIKDANVTIVPEGDYVWTLAVA